MWRYHTLTENADRFIRIFCKAVDGNIVNLESPKLNTANGRALVSVGGNSPVLLSIYAPENPATPLAFNGFVLGYAVKVSPVNVPAVDSKGPEPPELAEDIKELYSLGPLGEIITLVVVGVTPEAQ